MNRRPFSQILMLTVMTLLITNISYAETHLIIGSEDEENDAMILRPRQIEEGPDGNIYVLDGGDSCIKVYSPAGEYLRKLGGPGEGPGEFQRTDGATFGFTTDNKLFFTEFFGGHRWLTILELNGDLIRTLSPQLEVSYGIEKAVSLEDGSFLVQFGFNSAAYASNNYYLYKKRRSLVRMDSQGTVVTTIVQTEHPDMISYTPNGGTTNLPYTPTFVWAVRPNNTIIWSDGMNPQFSIFDFTGQTVLEFDTDLASPEKVTRDDLRNWCQNREELMESWNPTWWNQFGRVIKDYDKSLFDKPILRGISNAPAGHLLVEGPRNSETGQRTYRLFNKQGTMVSSVTSNYWSLKFSANYILYFSDHEDGSTSVNVVKWSGKVNEALSLLETKVHTND